MSTALYRRYRPDTFSDVIGQEHVTTPLMSALSKNRVSHAYLFSGPRGCGKTTSARILARCLNCAQGPTATPCGTCESCVELATGGPGSLDVIEIDAASHGGVDDARDLRERATFAPVRDRFKVFIIDEAHMVTSAGFNALLKIVEEPPEHIKFIFATTEPDKVIGTIRSRTHHYPFRLVPPEPLLALLERLCAEEGVRVAPGVLSLVIRAGGGSVRDTLSVLDQLIAGAGPDGIDYELAVALLGYTHASLLDDVVDSLAAQDAATVFSAVDRVIQTGLDPRRFVEDLLERFRDLIIVKAMPDSAAQVIRGLPEDQLGRMRQQASLLGQVELSRAADVTNQALTEMTGATSPRLHLELLCARLLLPTSDATERGLGARIDRVERRLAYGGGDVAAPPAGDDGGAPVPGGGTAAGGAPAQRPAAEPADPFGAAGGQGAAQVREALRAARQSRPGADAPAAPWNPGGTALPAAEAAGPAVPAQPAPVQDQRRDAPAPDAQPEPAPAARPEPKPAAGPEPARAAPPEPEPADRREPEQDPSGSAADWGGTWAAPPEPPRSDSRPVPAPENQRQAGAPAPENQRQGPAPAPQPERPEPAPVNRGPVPGSEDGHRTTAPAPARQQQPQAEAPRGPGGPSGPVQGAEPRNRPPQDGPSQDARPQEAPAPTAGSGGAGSVEMFRRAWPEILEALRERKKFLWMTVQPNASVTGFDGRSLTVSFSNPGALTHFSSRQENLALLQQCIHHVLGVQCEVVVTAGGSAPAGGSGPKADRRPTPAAAEQRPASPGSPVAPSQPEPAAPSAAEPTAPAAPAPAARPAAPAPASRPAAPAPTANAGARPSPGPDGPAPARRGQARPAPAGPAYDADGIPYADEPPPEDEPPFPDDPGGWAPPAGPASPAPPSDTQAPAAPAPRPSAPAPSAPPSAPSPTASAASPADAPAAPSPAGSAYGDDRARVWTPDASAAPPPAAARGSEAPPIPSWAGTALPGGAPAPSAAPAAEPPRRPASGRQISRYQQLLNQSQGPDRARPPAQPSAAPQADPRRAPANAVDSSVEDIPSDDDIAIEDSTVVGRAAVERILNGRLIEERNHDGSPVV